MSTVPQAEEPGGNAWQPIETAPKGREVLLWSPRYKQPVSIGDWGDYCIVNHPRWTHWMELPAAPGAAAAAPALRFDEDQQHTVERAADLLEHYSTFIARHVTSADIELHPYPPEIAGTAEELRELSKAAPGAAEAGQDAERLDRIRKAIDAYHLALDTRQHGGVAMDRAFNIIADAMGMPWVPGAAARAAQAQGGAA